MFLKKGTVRVHHFAHRPPVECAYANGETMEHMRAKEEIYTALKSSPRVTKLAIEAPIQKNGIGARPDVRFALDGDTFVAVEFQRASLDPREIERRTINYFKLKVHVLWVTSWPPKLTPYERYRPRETERYLHALYFGHVFMWHPVEGLRAVHFDKYKIDVEERDYYDGDGEEQSGGGYSYVSRQVVTPRVKGCLELLSLRPKRRPAFVDKWRTLPEALLLTLPENERSRAHW